jgi:peroxiredoxin (alkyl hydroperoxide reductase subunit C)
MLKIGETIPEVVMDAFHQEKLLKIKFSDYKGKWLIVLFYPADFTFVCPTELEEAALKYEEFQKLGAEIVSVSTDTAFVHKAWHDNSIAIAKVEYPMLADPSGKYCKMFGTYIEEEGLSLRSTFIIDPDQKLVAMDMHSNSIGRSTEEIFRKFQAAKFVYDNNGALVCPASWHPGDKTLIPGIDLVGKI